MIMKRIIMSKIFLVFVFLAFYLINVQTAAALPYSGTWTPSSDAFFAVELTNSSGSGSLWIYDGAQSLLVLNDGLSSHNTVHFLFDNGTYYASLDTSLDSADLNLGNTQDFGFYFSDGVNQFYTYQLFQIPKGSNNYLMRAVGMDVIVHDANPVPEPSTLLLLGSGLIGVGIYRWRRIKKK